MVARRRHSELVEWVDAAALSRDAVSIRGRAGAQFAAQQAAVRRDRAGPTRSSRGAERRAQGTPSGGAIRRAAGPEHALCSARHKRTAPGGENPPRTEPGTARRVVIRE